MSAWHLTFVEEESQVNGDSVQPLDVEYFAVVCGTYDPLGPEASGPIALAPQLLSCSSVSDT